MTWYDSSSHISVCIPVLVVAIFTGKLYFIDIRSRCSIASLRRRTDHFTSLLWNPFSPLILFAGTSSGVLLKYEVHVDSFVSHKILWELKLPFQIDSISLDPFEGRTCIVLSKSGRFAIIDQVKTSNPVRRGDPIDTSERISQLTFLPASADELLLVTAAGAALYTLKDGAIFPLLDVPRVQFLALVGGRALLIRGEVVELWDLLPAKPKLVSALALVVSRLPSPSDQIELFAYRNDVLLVLGRQWWVTAIEVRRERLFVTKRLKLMHSTPLDWSFTSDRITFSMKDGSILITGRGNESRRRLSLVVARPPLAEAPLSPARHLSRERGSSESAVLGLPDRTESLSQSLSTGSVGADAHFASDAAPTERRRRESFRMVAKASGDVLEQIGVEMRQRDASPAAPGALGLACDITYAYHLTDLPLRHVEWVASLRLIAWASTETPVCRNALFMVDLQSRSVIQLLRHLQRLPLTDIIFSRDHLIFCVVMNRCVASFFRTTTNPTLLFSMTFSSPISVAFAHTSDQAVIVTEKGKMASVVGLITRDAPVRLVRWNKVSNLPRGAITGIAVRRSKIFLGSITGAIAQIEMAAGPITITEARQMKHPVVKMVAKGRSSVLAMDERNHCVFLSDSDEWLPIPSLVKNAVTFGPLAFLCRIPNVKCLKVVQLLNVFKPLAAPLTAQLPVLRPPADVRAALREQPAAPEVCIAYGLPFLHRLFQIDRIAQAFQQYLLLLRRLVEPLPRFRARAVRVLCLLRDFRGAQELLMATPTDDPAFVANTMKAVLMGSPGRPGIEMGRARFVEMGFVDEAIDLLLITGNWADAANMLMEMGRLTEAALVCRVQDPSEERTQLITALARRMMMSGMPAYGLLMLAEIDVLDEIMQYLIGELEAEQAEFLRRVVCNSQKVE